MKKCLQMISVLMIFMLVFTGCSGDVLSDKGDDGAQSGAGLMTEEMTPEAEALLEEAIENVDEIAAPVQEYGESYGFNSLEGILLTHILYPVGEIEAMTEEVEDWVDQQVAYYEKDAEDYVHGEQKAELTVGYESRIVDGKLVCVSMRGVYDAPFMAHPVDVVKTFHGDLETGKLVALSDIVEEEGMETLSTMVTETAGVNPELVDDGLLNHWTLNEEGLQITLARGDYLPMSDGTKYIDFTYEQLEGILNLNKISADGDIDSSGGSSQADSDGQQEAALPEIGPADLTGIDPDKPMVALTFDDGPSAHTERLLDYFEEYGGKGTFFVVGNLIHDRQDTVIRMAEAGHEVAGHSWNHRQLTTLGEEDLQKQLLNTRAKIYKVTGVDATLMRPPYGSYNDAVKAMCADHGIALINWSVDTLDWKYRDADYVYKSVMDQAKDGAIILCHDLHGSTVDAMEKAIPALIEEGYQLVTVSQLLTSRGAEIEAGKVYYNR